MKIRKILSLLVTTAMMASVITAPAANETIVLPVADAASIDGELITDPENAVPTPFGDFRNIEFSFCADRDWFGSRQEGLYERLADFLNNVDWGGKKSETEYKSTGDIPNTSRYAIQWFSSGILYKVLIQYSGEVEWLIFRKDGTVGSSFYHIDRPAFEKEFNELMNINEYISQSMIDSIACGTFKSAQITFFLDNDSLFPKDEENRKNLEDFLKNDFVPMLRFNRPVKPRNIGHDYCIELLYKKDDTYDHRETYYIGGNGNVSSCGYDLNGEEETPTGAENFSIDIAEFERKLVGCGVNIKQSHAVTTTIAVSGTSGSKTTSTTSTEREVKTTLTTEDLKKLTTQTVFNFKEVVSYPTKTVYEVGDSLDFDGLRISAAWCLDENYVKDVTFSYRDYGLFTVTDKNGRKVSGDKFNTLGAGTYTVSCSGDVGAVYSAHYVRNIEFSYPVTINPVKAVTTTAYPVYTYPNDTTTTSTTTVTDYCTYAVVYFESVASYPTKTVYEAGEDLDISGLSVNVRSGGTCTEEYFSIRRFKITDEMGRSVNGDEFNTLPAGEYTVSHTGNTGYGPKIMLNPEFSYKVTINKRAMVTTTTTKVMDYPTSTVTTTEPEVWMYGTGIDHFVSIKTLPTKTIYKEGDKLDLSGLVINAYHSVLRHSNKGRGEELRTDYVWEIEKIAPEDITISDLAGKAYTVDEFSELKGGSAYVVKFGKDLYSSVDISIKGETYEKELFDLSGFTFRVYIDPSDKNSRFVRIDNAIVDSFEYGSSGNGGLRLRDMEPFSIDMDAHVWAQYHIESDLYRDDVVSGALYIDPDRNYIYFGDLEISEYGGKAGDVNCDGEIDMADAVLIMQALSNPNRYGINGTDKHHITKRGKIYGDVDTSYKGITTKDALMIQEYLIKKVESLRYNV